MLKQSPLTVHVRSARRRAPPSDPEYEIHCKWHFPTSSMPSEWSVWRTYDQFQAFDDHMRSHAESSFAKMMVTVVFASPHPVRMFFRQDRSDQFLDLRRKELDHYMQRIMAFPEVGEFETSIGSRQLAEFVQADKLWNNAIDATDRVQRLSTLEDLNKQQQYPRPISRSGSKRRLSRRKSVEIKQEIRHQIEQNFGERDLKKYKKRVREWKQANARMEASAKLVAFMQERFDQPTASFVLLRQLELCKEHENDLKEALLVAAEDAGLIGKAPHANDSQRSVSCRSSCSHTTSRSSALDAPISDTNKRLCSSTCSSLSLSKAENANPSPLKHNSSNDMILARVKFFAQGDKRKVNSFRKSAKALGTFQMSSEEFVSFVKTSFPPDQANEIVCMVSEAVPHSELQQELQQLVVKPPQ